MYMSTIVTYVISELCEILRNRYTLVSKSVSAVDRNGNKITILLYVIVQSIQCILRKLIKKRLFVMTLYVLTMWTVVSINGE